MNIAMFCVFSYVIFENADVTFSVISSVKIPMLLLGAMSLILMGKVYIGKLFSKKYFPTFLFLGVLVTALLVNAILNRNPILGVDPMRKTLRLILFLIDLFVLMVIAAEKRQTKKVLQFLYRYILLLIIANDFLMFSRVATFSVGRHETYLVGNKFSVSYLHMNFLMLWMINNKKSITSYRYSPIRMMLGVAFYLAVALRVNCMTGVVGCLILVTIFVLIESPRCEKLLKFASPGMLSIFIVGSMVFAFVAEIVLSIPIVSYVIKNVFGRDISLTGRTNIYALYTMTIPKHWLTGYGYGNAYDVTSTLFGFDNVQNALLQWVLQVGVIITAILIVFLLYVFSGITKRETRNMPSILAIVALIYTYVILGSVETTFSMSFVMCFALIFMLRNERPAGKISAVR